MQKPNHHIRDLHAGVVDVVLHIDFAASKSQQADKRVAQNGVAQMPNMRSFVGIDTGVLDQNLSRPETLRRRMFVFRQRRRQGPSVHPSVDVSRARNLKFLETLDRPNARNNFFRNFPRRLAQLLRQFKCERKRIFSKLHFRRLLDDNPLQLHAVFLAQKLAYLLG